MKIVEYLKLKNVLIDRGYDKEIDWSVNVGPPKDSTDFLCEYCWIVINSGMKEQVARKIWNRILDAWERGDPTSSVFKHKGKVKAIDYVRSNADVIFSEYGKAKDKLAFLKSLPFVGDITKYHLAKNFGFDVVKPDRHLVRIAREFKTTPDLLCRSISEKTGDRIGTVDLILWRAANLGMI